MTIRLESKSEDGVVMVKIKGQGGAWGRPVVDDQGNFYRSMGIAAGVMNVSQSTMRYAVENNELINNRIFAYATEVEVFRNVAPVEEPRNKTAATTFSTKQEKPFTAVRWPDGTVTVRLTQGGSWAMTRSGLAELPEEVRLSCNWVA